MWWQHQDNSQILKMKLTKNINFKFKDKQFSRKLTLPFIHKTSTYCNFVTITLAKSRKRIVRIVKKLYALIAYCHRITRDIPWFQFIRALWRRKWTFCKVFRKLKTLHLSWRTKFTGWIAIFLRLSKMQTHKET